MVQRNREDVSVVEPMSGDGLAINRGFLSRILLGALSGHEQRLLVARLLPHDAELRGTMTAAIGPFAMFDAHLARSYEAALGDGGPVEGRRQMLLAKVGARRRDLEALIGRFTVEDALTLGPATRELASWTMAEHLLERANRRDTPDHEVRTSLHLATMVIDVVALLALVGHAPPLPALVADVRRRIDAVAKTLLHRAAEA